MDGSRIRKEKVAFSNENGYVWTGPKINPLFMIWCNCIIMLTKYFL